jgi:hypothetical protein
MESLVQGKLARRVRWGGCRNVRSEKIVTRCVLTQSMRERLASLTRKCRHAVHRLETLEGGMYLIGGTYNFCWPHHELSTTKYYGRPFTPAMAAGLTDHIWSVLELLSYKIAPAPWVEPKRTRRCGKGAVSDLSIPKRPRGRPRKHPLPDPTVPKRPRGRPRKVA